MKTIQAAGVWMAFVLAGTLAAHPAAAQRRPQGWPGGDREAAAAKPVAAKPAAAAKAARAPRAKRAAADAKPPVVAVKLVLESVADAGGPKAAPEPTTVEVVAMLEQQAGLLRRLASEIEGQRAVMREQQGKIHELERRAAMTVETGGIESKTGGLAPGWHTSATAGVIDTFRLRRAELEFSGEMSPRVKWALMVDAAKPLAIASTTSSISGRNVRGLPGLEADYAKGRDRALTAAELTSARAHDRNWLGGFTHTLSNAGAWLWTHYSHKTFGGAPRDAFMTKLQTTW